MCRVGSCCAQPQGLVWFGLATGPVPATVTTLSQAASQGITLMTVDRVSCVCDTRYGVRAGPGCAAAGTECNGGGAGLERLRLIQRTAVTRVYDNNTVRRSTRYGSWYGTQEPRCPMRRVRIIDEREVGRGRIRLGIDRGGRFYGIRHPFP